jgi:hypothetical protein
MKAFVASLVLFATAVGLSSALGADAPDRPPGVAAQDWVPMGERVGLVIVRSGTTGPADRTGLFLQPPVQGYFMVKGRDTWSRLVVIEPPKGPGPAG